MDKLSLRLLKVEEKLEYISGSHAVYCKNEETIDDAVKRYNIAHKTKLNSGKVMNWGSFHFRDGRFYVSPNWFYEDELLRYRKRKELKHSNNEK